MFSLLLSGSVFAESPRNSANQVVAILINPSVSAAIGSASVEEIKRVPHTASTYTVTYAKWLTAAGAFVVKTCQLTATAMYVCAPCHPSVAHCPCATNVQLLPDSIACH